MFGGRLGGWELVIILAIILIIFGVGKLPQVGGAIGKGIREFRKAKSGADEMATDDDKNVVQATNVEANK